MRDHPPRRSVRGLLRARRGDDGFALVAAIGVAVVCLMLAVTVVAVSVRSAVSTGAGRDRNQAHAAAEAGADAVTAALDGAPATWAGACTSQATAPPETLTTDSAGHTVTSSYYTTVTFWTSEQAATSYRKPARYRDSDGKPLSPPVVAAGDVPCSSAASAQYAQVDSTGLARAGAGTQQVQVVRTVLQLPQGGPGYGILGNAVDLSGASYAVLDSGTSGMGVRTAATGDGSCGMYTKVRADVTISDGQLVTSSYCHIYGSVKAANGVTTGSYATIDGSVLTKPGKPVNVGAYSSTGTVTTSANDPAWVSTPLPQITDTLDDWTSQGFAVKPWPSSATCTLAAYATLTLTQSTPTVYDTRTACKSGLTPGAYSTIKISGADAVLLVNGFSASSYFSFTSDTTSRRVWVIAPAAASGSSCPKTPTNITLGTYTGTLAGVMPRLFLYSPCTVTLDSYTTMTGQVWGGTVDIGAYVSVTFADLGIPSGGSSGSGGVVRLSTS